MSTDSYIIAFLRTTALVCVVMTVGIAAPPVPQRASSPAKGPAVIAVPENIDDSLPNVLLIGDSISIGYTVAVREELAGKANVFRPPTNCGPTRNGVAHLDAWLGNRTWSVIHFNFGLHDLKYMSPEGKNLADSSNPASVKQVPPAEYVANLRLIFQRLQKTGAKLIWRETTPVPEGAEGRLPGDSIFYNQLAREVIQEFADITIDPMHDAASGAPIATEQRPANVHYTPKGSRQLGRHVAQQVSTEL